MMMEVSFRVEDDRRNNQREKSFNVLTKQKISILGHLNNDSFYYNKSCH